MSEFRINDDAVLWAVNGRRVSAQQALLELAHRPLLLLMHGFGSFEGDLIELAPQLPQGFVCASPRAPLAAPAPIVNGFSWWELPLNAQGLPLKQADPTRFTQSQPHAAAEAVLNWLDALNARVREATGTAKLGTIALLGFSQGGCLVTSLLRLRPERFACGVNCSGFVAPGDFAGDTRLAEVRPPMFWGRDEADPIIDDHRIALTAAWAPAHTALETRLYEGMLHAISAAELLDIGKFLERHVPDAVSAQL